MNKPWLYPIIRPLLVIWFCITYLPKYKNKSVIPKKGRVILAGNHTNAKDAILLGTSTTRWVRYLSKDSLTKGLFGFFIKAMGVVAVNRKIQDKTVIPAAIKLLEAENVVAVFPEGTINRTDDIIMPFKAGAIKMAIQSNTPIIPFVIKGEYKVFRKRVRIIFGDLYYPKTKDITK